MLVQERQSRLVKLFHKADSWPISRLAAELRVSAMTVRRDLDHLEAAGKVTRVHGGAVANEGIRFGQRMQTNRRTKMHIVAKIAGTLPDTGSVYFDGSTTVYNLCDHLAGSKDLQVATNNIQTFQRLAGLPGVRPLLLGGGLDTRTDNLVGPMARRSLQFLNFDAAYMSCYAFHDRLGAMECTIEDSEIKELAAQRSGRIYLCLEDRKLNMTAPGSWILPVEKTELATNLDANNPKLAEARRVFAAIR